TLRLGGPASEVLAGCEYSGAATVKAMMYDIDGRFPAIILYGDADVHGEIWHCPADLLARLDEYEGVSSGLFRRVGIEASAGDAPVPAWIYAAGPALSRHLTPENRLSHGSWSSPGP